MNVRAVPRTDAFADSPAPEWVAGRYRILAPIGRGGMGRVFVARCEQTGTRVAIKLLRTERSGEFAGNVDRFQREARILQELRHPNTVRLHDHGFDDEGNAFIVMEFVPGKTVHQLVRELGPFDERHTLDIAIQVAASVQEAHDRGIVHRDIKSANVMLARDDPTLIVKVLDFGVGKQVGPVAEEVTVPGHFVGSFSHSAPEQLLGGKPDPRSDIYSLGILLFEMLTGAVPFRDSDAGRVMLAHLQVDPPALREVHQEARVSAATEDVVRRCLEKNPEDRWQSAFDLLSAMRACRDALDEEPDGFPDDDEAPTLIRRPSSSGVRAVFEPAPGSMPPTRVEAVRAHPVTEMGAAGRHPETRTDTSGKHSPTQAGDSSAPGVSPWSQGDPWPPALSEPAPTLDDTVSSAIRYRSPAPPSPPRPLPSVPDAGPAQDPPSRRDTIMLIVAYACFVIGGVFLGLLTLWALRALF